MPPVFDTGGANMLYSQISGTNLSEEYFQRLPIRFRRIGRTRVYDFDDIVAYVKELRAKALVKNAGRRGSVVVANRSPPKRNARRAWRALRGSVNRSGVLQRTWVV